MCLYLFLGRFVALLLYLFFCHSHLLSSLPVLFAVPFIQRAWQSSGGREHNPWRAPFAAGEGILSRAPAVCLFTGIPTLARNTLGFSACGIYCVRSAAALPSRTLFRRCPALPTLVEQMFIDGRQLKH